MSFDLPSDVPTQLFLNGEFVDAKSGETFDSPNPATGQTLVTIQAAGQEDVDAAVANAREVFNSGVWSQKSPAERGEVLLAFAQAIENNLEELAQIEAIDAGKTITDCRDFDFPDVISTLRFYAQAVDKVFGKVSPTGPDALGYIVREPMGVVGAVLPWNFPAAMLMWKLAPALAAGNSVVVKPPELSSLTTLRLAQLAVDSGLPAGVMNVIPGLGHVAGKALGLHMDVDLISFTGSVRTGREFLRYSAESNLKEIVLELGGKSAQIVTESWKDDLATVAEDLAGAAFGNNGQNCTAGSLVLVHSSIKDELTQALKAEAEKLVVGDPRDEKSTNAALIEDKALQRVSDYVDSAREDGATIITGGERVLEETGGYFYAPTVIADISPDAKAAQEEIFGPVTCVIPFETEEEALAIANGTDYGLAGTVWTKDVDQAIRMSRGFRAGTIAINGYSEGDMTTPFGGYKQSGFGGRDNGIEALEQFSQIKTIWYTVR